MAVRGWVYVISNKAMLGMVKVGYSTKDPELRAVELNHTGTPYPYSVEYDLLTEDPYQVEQMAHKLLSDQREGKEWFRCSIEEAKAAILKATCGRNSVANLMRDDRESGANLTEEHVAEVFHHSYSINNSQITVFSCPKCAQKVIDHGNNALPSTCPSCGNTFNEPANPDQISSSDFFHAFGSLDLKIIFESWEKVVASWRDDDGKVKPSVLSDEIDYFDDWNSYKILIDNFARKISVFDGDALDKIIAERIPVWSDGMGSLELYELFAWIHYIFRAKKSSQFVALEIVRRLKNTKEALVGGQACYIAGLPEMTKRIFEKYLPVCEDEFNPDAKYYFNNTVILVRSLAVMTAMLTEDFKRDGRYPPQYFVDLVNKFVPKWARECNISHCHDNGIIMSEMIRFVQYPELDYPKYPEQLERFLSPMTNGNYEPQLNSNEWSLDTKTKELQNKRTGRVYPSSQYTYQQKKGEGGFKILSDTDILVNVRNVDFK